MELTYRSSRGVLPAPPMSIATTALGPSDSKAIGTGLGEEVWFAASATMTRLASAAVKISASRLPSRTRPMVMPLASLTPLSR